MRKKLFNFLTCFVCHGCFRFFHGKRKRDGFRFNNRLAGHAKNL